jgi:hypothetical protein
MAFLCPQLRQRRQNVNKSEFEGSLAPVVSRLPSEIRSVLRSSAASRSICTDSGTSASSVRGAGAGCGASNSCAGCKSRSLARGASAGTLHRSWRCFNGCGYEI